MKFDEQLAAYLYQYKSLRLEGIGTFTLDEKVRIPGEQEKEVYYPIEGLTFTYNPKSTTEENVIVFLAEKLHKIEPLIRSDLESYLSNIKIFLNIGNPYTIEGIGTLQKNNQGIYEFTPGGFFHVKEELNPKSVNAIPEKSKYSAGRISVIILAAIAAVAALSGIGWAIFNFSIKQSAPKTTPESQKEDNIVMLQTDTMHIKKDTQNINSKPTAVLTSETPVKDAAGRQDSAAYKMIFEVTKSKERAISRTAQLNSLHSYSHYDSIPINDSVAYYRLFLRMKIASRDTSRIKDSLRIFFGKKIFMEKQDQSKTLSH